MKKTFTLVFLIAFILISGCGKDKIMVPETPPVTTPPATTLPATTPPATTPPVSTIPSKANLIETFNFNSFGTTVNGSVDTMKNSITFSFPENPGVDPGPITPNITVSPKATLTTAITPQDFLSAVPYSVRSESGLDRTFTAQAITPAFSKLTPVAPDKMCFYNGYPSLVNGANGDVNQAARFFAQFDVIIFGDHIFETSHGDHYKTIDIIALLKAIKPAVKIFGYIPLGPTRHLSTSELLDAISNWADMKVTGVFGDEFDYAYGNTRERQNAFIDFAHNKGLKVFVNSFTIDNALADYNGDPTHLLAGDYELLENLLVSQGSYRDFNDFAARGNKAYKYMRTKGIKIAVVATVPFASLNSSSGSSEDFKYAWCGTAMYNFDAFQFTDTDYSGNTVTGSNNVLYFYNNPLTSYGSTWKQYDWIKADVPNQYSRSTNSNTIKITSDHHGVITTP